MLEYSFDEAIELLTTNKSNAQESLISIEEDFGFLRDQITTSEVNIARCHNHGVKLRAQERARQNAEAAAGSEE